MDKFNFDSIIPRDCSNSIKYNNALYGKPADAVPMWVADMDFKVSPAITQAINECAQHGVFGYYSTQKDYDLALCSWYRNRFGWDVLPGWNTQTPNVIFALAAAIRALTKEGDAVIISQPVYPPFTQIVNESNRKLVVNELVLKNGRYEMDFETFESQIKENNVKAFIFCSPHNPVGRVWTEEEIKKTAQICVNNNVFIISDEIHADLVFTGNKHTPIASVSDEAAAITVTCTAPTKTFNMAGLQAANIFIKNPDIKQAFRAQCDKTGYHLINTIGAHATLAAYKHGAPWLEQLLKYLENNAAYLDKTLKEINSPVSLIKPEGTYLMWLDCRAMGLSDTELEDFFINKAKLWLNTGASFGKGGSGFMRMNIACPIQTLKQALENLKKAF
ncbi:cystathionine beta-lyase [Elusimicrobium posterum]|uniref:MalY/PatB family protein n=1 Tax=Elusimicrobium posterum TaxID=3116653 RepID=UPI003C70A7BB